MMKVIVVAILIIGIFAVMAIRQSRAEGVSHLKEGDSAPLFSLRDQNGRLVNLTDFSGNSWVVLYFYPKDDTPGCTKEACDFRDNFKQLARLDAVVLGVSVDTVESHEKFSEKFRLTFPLLADEDKKISLAYGVLTSYLGFSVARRTTFLIDPSGKIRKVFPSVNPTGHASEVARALSGLK
jgi:thioredoxin-dependent peroxiredoxin